jgi:branched-chain amino acid transport system permease protein
VKLQIHARPHGVNRTAVIIAAILIVLAVLVTVARPGGAFLGEADLLLLAAFGAYGLNLITGYAGLASIGNAGFMAVGGISAWFVSQHIANFALSVIAGGLVGFLLGGAVGVIALRWSGFYLVLATLAVQYIVVFGLQQVELGGSGKYVQGFSFAPASLFGHALISDSDWFTLLAIVLAVTILGISGLVHRRFGRAWMSLRENETAASVAGVPVARRKILAFAVGSGVIAFGGALASYYVGSMSYESYTLDVSVSYVAMIIIGGLGSMSGPLLGACVVTLLPYWIQNEANTSIGRAIANINGGSGLPFLETLLYCVIVLLFLVFEPLGLAHLGPRLARAAKRLLMPPRQADRPPGSTRHQELEHERSV